MNIIVIVIDTLRYDYIAAMGPNASWLKTPNLDRLANQSLVFDRAFSSSYPTIPHRTDVITGQYGAPFNPWMPLRFDITPLPQHLAKAGYATQLIHDTPHLVNGGCAFDWPFHGWTFVRGAEVDRPWIDDKGFEYLDNWTRDPEFDIMGDPELSNANSHTIYTYVRANRNRHKPVDWNAAKLFLTASEFLRDNAKRDNFFLWVDCFDPHGPDDAPPEFVRMYDRTPGYDGKIDPRAFLVGGNADVVAQLSETGRNRLNAMYAAKVTHLDHWFGKVLDALEETGLSKNTAVILTADHGTCQGEFSLFTKRVAGSTGEQEAHVPMLVSAPGLGHGRCRIDVQPQDIFGTVIRLAGLEEVPGSDGRDLLALADGTSTRRSVTPISGAGLCQGWDDGPRVPYFTAFGDTHYLNVAADPEACRLFQYGSTENTAAQNAAMVETLRQAALEELRARNTHPDLIEWFATKGKHVFPKEARAWPGPPEWISYWGRNYDRWD